MLFHSRAQKKALNNALRLGWTFFPFTIFLAIFEFSLPLKLDHIEAELFIIGAFISAGWILTTALDFYWGAVIDHFGKKKIIYLSVILFAIFTFGFALTENIFLLLILDIAAYTVFDVFYIALEGLLIDISAKKYFNFSASGFFSVWSLAYTLAPLIAALCLIKYGYYSVYWLGLPLAGVTLIAFGINFSRNKHLIRDSAALKVKFNWHFFFNIFKKEYLPILGIFFCTFWYGIMTVGLPLLFVIEEENLWHSAIITAVFAVPFVFTDFFDGFIATKKRYRFYLICGGFLLGGAALILLFFSPNFYVSLLAAFLSTIGINLAWATFEIEAGLIADAHDSGRVESLFVFAKNMGWDTSPFIFGLVASFFGIRAPFVMIAVIILILPIFYFKQRKQIH